MASGLPVRTSSAVSRTFLESQWWIVSLWWCWKPRLCQAVRYVAAESCAPLGLTGHASNASRRELNDARVYVEVGQILTPLICPFHRVLFLILTCFEWSWETPKMLQLSSWRLYNIYSPSQQFGHTYSFRGFSLSLLFGLRPLLVFLGPSKSLLIIGVL